MDPPFIGFAARAAGSHSKSEKTLLDRSSILLTG